MIKVGEFKALAPSGAEYTIEIYEQPKKRIHFMGGSAIPEGPTLKALQTNSGTAVNRLEKGKYQIVGHSEVLTSTDPNAP